MGVENYVRHRPNALSQLSTVQLDVEVEVAPAAPLEQHVPEGHRRANVDSRSRGMELVCVATGNRVTGGQAA